MENYGIPIAWKVDSRIAFLLKSDLKHFSELLVSTFLHDRFLLNDKLPIIRIECKFTLKRFTYTYYKLTNYVLQLFQLMVSHNLMIY